MPVINGVYLKDFPALPSSVVDANIIPIAESGNQVAYRTTVGGIVTDARVTGKVLTGLSVTGGAIASTDTILQAFGKVQNQLNNRVTSVGLSMPSAFTVTNSPVTGTGTLTVTGAGLATQYIRGDGQLADFPTGGGGGSSVSYYLNGSVNQGTFSGDTYYEMNKNAILGAGTDFTISADGYIASFITDANDPNLLLIPGGNWNLEFYFNASSGGGSPSFYVELSKWNGSSFTAIASNSSNPELIAFGTSIQPYFATLAVPETVLLATDRLAIRVYVNHSGRTITLHTENNTLCQIITTFTTGLQSLNGLTKQTQFFSVGTSGNDFNISSATDTHTFNLPSASTNIRGLVTTSSQTFAGEKTFFNGLKSLNTLRVDLSSTPNTTGLYSNTSGTGRALYAQADTGNAAWLYNFGTGNEVLKVEVGNLTGALATFNNTGGQVVLISNAGNITANSFIKSGGTSSQFLKADGSVDGTAYGTGSVTSVSALTLGTSGTDLSSTVANSTTTPVITLNVPTASATNRGALSSTDWTTFNSKQNTITLTTTGTSGVATFIANTLNIPDYGGALSAYLPLAGGTMTGAIVGTTSTFTNSGTGVGVGVTNSNASGDGIKITHSAGRAFNIQSSGAGFGVIINNETASTSAPFTIQKQGSNVITMSDTGAATFSGALSGTSATFSSTASATAFIPSGASVPTNGLFLPATNAIGFSTNTTERMRIFSGGNVAIGTTTDGGFKLDVNGTGRFSGNLTINNGSNTYIYGQTTSSFVRLDNSIGAQIGYSNYSVILDTEGVKSVTNGSERMRITAGGNVLIGTTTDSGEKFQVTGGRIYANGTGTSSGIAFNNYGIHQDASTNLIFLGSGVERMRITSGGDVLVNATAVSSQSEKFGVTASNLAAMFKTTGGAANNWAANFWNNGTSGNNLFVEFGTETSYLGRGSITYNRGSGVVAYNTTSDYRLKSEIQDFNALSIIDNLKPKEFRIADAENKSIGFIAHELQEYYPQAVTGVKDEVNEHGKPIYQGVDYSQLTGLLVKAIQELKAEIDILKSK